MAPAAILWPDKERQWEPLLPELRKRLPLLTLGPYAPAERMGPAYYLRCMIARTLPDDVLPADATPIIYLPGVSRQELRAIEECPKHLQPLAELQYRGVLWTHKNGRDWTVAGFLQNADDGLGVPVGADSATRDALLRALPVLARQPVGYLRKEAPLRAPFFWIEVGLCALLPAILMVNPKFRTNKNALLAAAGAVVAGGILNRLNVSIFGHWSFYGPIYFPSWMEIVLSLALVSFGVVVFIVAVKYLPVFPREAEEQGNRPLQGASHGAEGAELLPEPVRV